MLPNLRRLALCPTSSNNYEAGGSNDLLPSADDPEEDDDPIPTAPDSDSDDEMRIWSSDSSSDDTEDELHYYARRRPRKKLWHVMGRNDLYWVNSLDYDGSYNDDKEPSQSKALGISEIVNAILVALADGDVKVACRTALDWCNLTHTHKGWCNDETAWEALVGAVFVLETAAIPRSNAETWKHYFFRLCYYHQERRKMEEARVPEIARRNREAMEAIVEAERNDLAEYEKDETYKENVRYMLSQNFGDYHFVIKKMLEARLLMERAAVSGRWLRDELQALINALERIRMSIVECHVDKDPHAAYYKPNKYGIRGQNRVFMGGDYNRAVRDLRIAFRALKAAMKRKIIARPPE